MEVEDMDISRSEEEKNEDGDDDDEESELAKLLSGLNGMERCLIPIAPVTGRKFIQREERRSVSTKITRPNETNNNDIRPKNQPKTASGTTISKLTEDRLVVYDVDNDDEISPPVSPTNSNASTLSRGPTPEKELSHCPNDKEPSTVAHTILDNDSDSDVIVEQVTEYRKEPASNPIEKPKYKELASNPVEKPKYRKEPASIPVEKPKECPLQINPEPDPKTNDIVPLNDVESLPKNNHIEDEPAAVPVVEAQDQGKDSDSDSDCLIVEHIAASEHLQNGCIDLTKPVDDDEVSIALANRSEESLVEEIIKIRKALHKHEKKRHKKERKAKHKSKSPKKKKKSTKKSRTKSPSLDRVSDTDSETRTITFSESGRLSVSIVSNDRSNNSSNSANSRDSPPRSLARSPPISLPRSPPRFASSRDSRPRSLASRSPPRTLGPRSPPRFASSRDSRLRSLASRSLPRTLGPRSPPRFASFRDSPPRSLARSPPRTLLRSPRRTANSRDSSPRSRARSPPRTLLRSPPRPANSRDSPPRSLPRSPPRTLLKSPPRTLLKSPPRTEQARSPPRTQLKSPPRTENVPVETEKEPDQPIVNEPEPESNNLDARSPPPAAEIIPPTPVADPPDSPPLWNSDCEDMEVAGNSTTAFGTNPPPEKPQNSVNILEMNPLKRKLSYQVNTNLSREPVKRQVFCESSKEMQSKFRRKNVPKAKRGRGNFTIRTTESKAPFERTNFNRFLSDSEEETGHSPRSRVSPPPLGSATSFFPNLGLGRSRSRRTSPAFSNSYRRSRSPTPYRSRSRSPSCYRRRNPSSCRSPARSFRSKSRHKTPSQDDDLEYRMRFSRSPSFRSKSRSARSKSRTYRSPSPARSTRSRRSRSRPYRSPSPRSRRSRSRAYRSPSPYPSRRSVSSTYRSPARSRRSKSRTYRSPSRLRRSKSRTYRSPSRSRRSKSRTYRSPSSRSRRSKSRTYGSPPFRSHRSKSRHRTPRERSSSRSPSEIRAARKCSPLEDMRQELRKNNEAAVQQALALGGLEKPANSGVSKASSARIIDDLDLTKSSPSPDNVAEPAPVPVVMNRNAPTGFNFASATTIQSVAMLQQQRLAVPHYPPVGMRPIAPNLVRMPVPVAVNQMGLFHISHVYSQAVGHPEQYVPMYPHPPHHPYM